MNYIEVNKILYIVTGFMRTGTSMMMKALEVGGMPVYYIKARDGVLNKYSDNYYNPNKDGLYELSLLDETQLDFPRQYEGKLIKVIHSDPVTMSVMENGIRIVFMRRDEEEVRQSSDAFFTNGYIDMDEFQERMDKRKGLLQNRKDVASLNEFWYRDVLENPRECFEQLFQAGWDIDIDKATRIVNPGLCRFKKEELAIGVY